MIFPWCQCYCVPLGCIDLPGCCQLLSTHKKLIVIKNLSLTTWWTVYAVLQASDCSPNNPNIQSKFLFPKWFDHVWWQYNETCGKLLWENGNVSFHEYWMELWNRQWQILSCKALTFMKQWEVYVTCWLYEGDLVILTSLYIYEDKFLYV